MQWDLTGLEKVSTLEKSGGEPYLCITPQKTLFVMKEVIIYVTDSLGVAHPETIERASIFFLSLVFRVIQKPRI